MDGSVRRGVVAAIAAAVTFGVAAPVAKRLLDHAGVAALSFLLYLGAFLAMTTVAGVRRRTDEAPLRASDGLTLAAIAMIGGIAGPLLLLFGLARTGGVAGSLLLNVEAPLTVVLAVALFGEHLSRRMAVSAAAVFLGGALLALDGGVSYATTSGALAIVGACAAWAIDNNLTQRLSLRDPVRVVQYKAGAAALGLGGIAVGTGSRFPTAALAIAAVGVGVVGYGLSIVLDVYALRAIGAAREAALFATAPFVGAVTAIALFSERPTRSVIVATAVMAAGAVGFVRSTHGHVHAHEPVSHDHVHAHDEHHRHAHPPGMAIGEEARHSHAHEHGSLTHSHGHASDVHHRHTHR